MERVLRGLLTKTFDSLPKAPSCALTLEGMVLGGGEITGRLSRLDRDNISIIKNMELSTPRRSLNAFRLQSLGRGSSNERFLP